MAKRLEGVWFGRSPDHYVTRGAEVRRTSSGWFAVFQGRARGPLSSLDVAFNVADKMLAEHQEVRK